MLQCYTAQWSRQAPATIRDPWVTKALLLLEDVCVKMTPAILGMFVAFVDSRGKALASEG